MGIPCVKAALRRLHGVKPTPAAFLHHHRLDKLHIFGDAVLFGIFLYQRLIGFHLCTDRGIGVASASADKQGNSTAEQDNNENNHNCNPTACNYSRNQSFCSCNNRLDRSYGGSDRRFGGFGGCLCGDFCRLCCLLGSFRRNLCRCLCGFYRGFCRFDCRLRSCLCGFNSLFGCLDRSLSSCFHRFFCISGCGLNHFLPLLSGLYQLRFCCLGNIGGRGTACSPVTDLQAVLF